MDREKQIVHQFKKRAGWQDVHHLTAQSEGGKNGKSNKSMLDAYRHDAYHLLFGTSSLKEAQAILKRWEQLKENCKVTII